MVSQAKAADTRHILMQALNELSKVDPQRMQHILMVEKSLKAVKHRNVEFFISAIPPERIESEKMQFGITDTEYKKRYESGLTKIFQLYANLPAEAKTELEFTVLAHDLGFPVGIDWEHHVNGAKIVRRLIKDSKYREPISALVEHHGQFSNLASSAFARDIYRLSSRLHHSLFILDFCDGIGRTSKEGNHVNPIGLTALDYYLRFSQPSELRMLERPEESFELRCKYGFASAGFNRSLPAEAKTVFFETASKLVPKTTPETLIHFYGNTFRCYFLDVLLFPGLKEPEKMGVFLAEIFALANQFPMQRKDVLLWPDLDLGKILERNFDGFVKAFRAYYEENGINGLIKNSLLPGRMNFFVSRLV